MIKKILITCGVKNNRIFYTFGHLKIQISKNLGSTKHGLGMNSFLIFLLLSNVLYHR